MAVDIGSLSQGIRAGKRRSLAKGLTLIESRRSEDRLKAQELLDRVYSDRMTSHRIGISGSPGVGKSTFIEAFGTYFLDRGHRLAVLAIDPSSPRSHGSILGDKTRMQDLAVAENCFIRPSPAGLSLGGVARRTREAILLCEAAGYDTILIETVGVGQSEHVISTMVDLFLCLTLPHAGDQLQGIKKGIMELADLVIVTKADGAFQHAARQAAADHQAALHYLRPDPERLNPEVYLCSAVEKHGLETIYQAMQRMLGELKTSGRFERRRQHQNQTWFQSEIYEQLMEQLQESHRFQTLINDMETQVASAALPAPTAAGRIVQEILRILKL